MKIESASHNYQVLYAGFFIGQDNYGVYRVSNGRAVQVGRLFCVVSLANSRCQQIAESEGVQWFGR